MYIYACIQTHNEIQCKISFLALISRSNIMYKTILLRRCLIKVFNSDTINLYSMTLHHCCNTGNASSFTLSVANFPPGDYNVTVDAVDIFGQFASAVVELFLSGKSTK